ncbi:MAG: HipA domain-containing protein [Sandaracinaceae bacterium]
MEWASACGLEVPEHRVIHASEIENLPEDFDPDQDVFIVRRFDRRDDGTRIHQEDFAQVFDVAPEERYAWESADLGWVHYGSIGAVIGALCGEDDYREYARRLVFMVLSGNADAHIKNWALVYPDGLRARLSPLYDFVSTAVYPSLGRHSALRWSEPPAPTLDPAKRLVDVTMDDLLEAASYADGAATPELIDDLAEFAQRVRTTWVDIAKIAPAFIRERVEAHLTAATLEQ